jgi:epsilon-lactone hydrolase
VTREATINFPGTPDWAERRIPARTSCARAKTRWPVCFPGYLVTWQDAEEISRSSATEARMANVNEKAHQIAIEAHAWNTPDLDLPGMRAGFDGMLPDPAEDVTVTEAEVGGVAGRWVEAPGAGDTVVLHVHGGGNLIGSSVSHRDLAARISRAAGARVFVADFARAPEAAFPKAFDDVVAAYRGLLDSGVAADKIVISGDSAGGGIAVGVTSALAGEGLARPAAVVAIAPLVDWTFSGESIDGNAATDPLVSRAMVEMMAGAYLQGADPKDPRASALFADLDGFPPLLVHVADAEILLDDSRRLVEAVQGAGGQVELHVADGLFHIYHLFADKLPEAQASIDEIGRFVRTHTA